MEEIQELDLSTMTPSEGEPFSMVIHKAGLGFAGLRDLDPRLQNVNELEKRRFLYRKYKRDWISRHPEAYKEANQLYCRRYYAKNRDKVREQARKHYWGKQARKLDDAIALLKIEMEVLSDPN